MKIGELAQRTGLTASTIRFYESKGLLNAVSRQSNGYREYPLEAVAVLNIITSAQQTGFTLDEIKQVIPEDFSTWRHDELMAALTKKIGDIEAMELRLAQSKALSKRCRSRCVAAEFPGWPGLVPRCHVGAGPAGRHDR